MKDQKLISIILVLMLSFVLVFASCGPDNSTGDGGDGGSDSGDGGSDSGDGGSDGGSDSGDGGSDSGDGGSDSGDGGDTGGMDEAEKLTLNSWKEDNFEEGTTKKWFYFDATPNQAYVVYTVDKYWNHPEDPNNGDTPDVDNEIGLYRANGNPYTYEFPENGTGQHDVYVGEETYCPYIACIALEDKVYVKVTPLKTTENNVGNYFIKCNEAQKLTISLDKTAAVTETDMSKVASISPSAGEHFYEKDETVEIIVSPEEGYRLSEWTGDASTETETSINVTMNADKTVGAVVDAFDGFTLTTHIVGEGTIAKNPEPGVGGAYNSDQDVTLTATPAAGWVFDRWFLEGSGEDHPDETHRTSPWTITMDRSKDITAHFVKEAEELTVGEWKAVDLEDSPQRWFYFTAESGEVYEIYSHDKTFYHPENPSGNDPRSFDNKIGAYKEMSSEEANEYTYSNIDHSVYNHGQVDLYVGLFETPRPYLEVTPAEEEDKVWVNVTPINSEAGTGPSWVKVIEKDETKVTFNLTVEGKTDDDSFDVYVNGEKLNPDTAGATPLVYSNINKGRAVSLEFSLGDNRKVEFSGDDAGKLIDRPNCSDKGIKMDADKSVTITFSAK